MGTVAKVDVKANLNSNIKYMLSFLSDNQYPQTLSKKNLVNPTEATFKEVFKFIIQTMSPSFDMKRIGTAVPEYLLALGYPYNLKESYFKPVGSPHSWPHVLESLVWLSKFVQQSEYEGEHVSTLLTMACQDIGKAQDDELWHLAESQKLYKKFNQSLLSMEEVEEEYKHNRNSQERCAVKQRRIDELRSKIDAQKAKKDGHEESRKTTVKSIEEKRQGLETCKQDLKNFEELKNQKDQEKDQIRNAAKCHKNNTDDLLESLEHHRLQQADLESIISKQPPQLEVQKKKQKMKLLKEQRGALKADIDKKSAECWRDEITDSNTQLKIREDFRQVDEHLKKVVPKHCIRVDGFIDNKVLVQVKSTLDTITVQAKDAREESARREHKVYKEQIQLQDLLDDYQLLEDDLKSKASQRKYKDEDNERMKQKILRGSARLDEEVEKCRKKINELKTELNVELDVSTIDEKLIRLLAEIDDETERDDILCKMSVLNHRELEGASSAIQFNKSLIKLFKARAGNILACGV